MLGIITLPSFLRYNYGGVLQNYALTHYLQQQGYAARAVRCDAYTFADAILLRLYKTFRLRVRIVRGALCIEFVPQCEYRRSASFEAFIAREISPLCFPWYSRKTCRALNARFDAMVVGSDQVWNPEWAVYKNSEKTLFLEFVPPEKRFAYAASFGVSALPAEKQARFAQALRTFRAISVREDSGAEIVKALTGREVPVLPDPTLLLSAEEWRAVAAPAAAERGEPYLLSYFLGEQSEEQRALLHKRAEKYGLRIVALCDETDLEAYTSGPAEFLSLIDHASLVCTDSFHATVFSILFGTPFVVENRVQSGLSGMSSRIDTLLTALGLAQRKPGCVSEENLMDCDYAQAHQQLCALREKANTYFAQCFSEENAVQGARR